MKFNDVLVNREERFSIGREVESGKYYISIPVANRRVDYEEYYEINEELFQKFIEGDGVLDFVKKCKNRKMDERLIIKPGSDRGQAY